MYILRHMDPELYDEVLRRRAAVWTDFAAWLTRGWKRARMRRPRVETPVLPEEVLADLAYGRD